MPQIGCEICLKLQKTYSEALRKYVNALDVQTGHIERADYPVPTQVRSAIVQADVDCANARRILESHEVAEHQKKAAYR